MDQAIQTINAKEHINKETKKLAKLLEKSKEEIEQVESMILDLYPDWKAGVISKEEYMKLKKKFDEQKEKAIQRSEDLKKNQRS